MCDVCVYAIFSMTVWITFSSFGISIKSRVTPVRQRESSAIVASVTLLICIMSR